MLEILYRDARYVAVHKPAGMLVHRSALTGRDERPRDFAASVPLVAHERWCAANSAFSRACMRSVSAGS